MTKKKPIQEGNQQSEQNDTPIILTPDDLAFIAAYFEENMNGTRAYMKLHPKAAYDSARSSASEILTKDNIKNEIRRRLSEKAMSAEEALARLGEMARAELKPFIRIDNDGFAYFNLAYPQAQEYLYLIKKMKTKRERRIEGSGKEAQQWEGEWVEVELHDAQSAIRDILKVHGKFVEKIEHSGNIDIHPSEMKPSEIAERVAAILELKKNAKRP